MNIYQILKPLSNDNRSLSRYVKLIEHYSTVEVECQYERHHPLPKSIFPEHIGYTIKLPVKAHYLAHLLLHKIIGGKMTQAFHMMCNRLEKTASREYEKSRKYQSQTMSTNNPNKDGKQSKKAWDNSPESRRDSQREIMNQVNKEKWKDPKAKQDVIERNKRLKSIKRVFRNVHTGETATMSIPDFAKKYNLNKQGLEGAFYNKRLYKKEWAISPLS